MLKTTTVFLACAIPFLVCAAHPGELEFKGNNGRISLAGQAEILVDSAANLTPQEAAFAKGYSLCISDVPNLQLTRAAYWIRFVVKNASPGNQLVLGVPYSEIDELDVYTLGDAGVQRIGSTGRTRRLSERNPSDRAYVFELPMEAGASKTLMFRVHGFKPIHFPVSISAPGAAALERSQSNFLLGAYAGIMVVMALYNLFIYFSIRDKSYLFYSLYILVISAAQTTLLGSGPLDFVDGSTWLSSRASLVFALLASVLGIEFARRFIGTEQYVPRLHRSGPVVYAIVLVILGVYLFGDPWTGYNLGQAISGITAVYTLLLVISAVRKGSRQAGFFLLAWAAFLIGVVLFVMKDAGAIPYGSLGIYAMPIGSAIEGVLLCFGLADRINILRRDKERSQAEALAALQENERIIRDQNAILEQKVTERTHELVEANEEIKRTQVQLVNAEKMAGLGQLTAGIAHEINNPINFINSNIPPLRRNLQDIVQVLADFRSVKEGSSGADLKAAHEKCEQLGLDESINELDGMIASIDEGARRTAEIVKGLRNFSRLDEDAVKKADINEGIRSTIGLLSPQIKGRVEIHTALAELPQADCHPGKLNQAVMNLLTNAAQAVRAKHGDGGDGAVSIRSWHENGIITIAVQDNGCGMDETVKSRVFEPFFTTKGVGEGTGLGLSITYSIVQKHNGTIAVESTPGQGSEFRISIPVVQQEDNIALRA